MGNSGSNYSHDDHIDSITHHEDRSCKDVFFLILFILFFIGFIAVSILAFMEGDPRTLFYPENSDGNTCGSLNPKTNKDYLTKKYLYRPDVTSPKFSICVSACPSKGSVDDLTCDVKDLVCKDGAKQERANTWPLTSNPSCWCPYKTKNYFYRCSPSGQSGVNATAIKSQVEENAKAQRVSILLGDVANFWYWLAASVGLAVVLCFIWLVILAWASKFMVWMTLILFLVMLFALTGASYWQWTNVTADYEAQKADGVADSDLNDNYILALQIIFYTLCGLCAIALILVIWLARKITTAAQIVDEAATAVKTMKGIFLFPLWMFLAQFGFVVYWCATAMFLGSMPDPPTNSMLVGIDNVVLYLRLYALFALFWVIAFIAAVGHMTIAGAVAQWYWSSDQEKEVMSEEEPVLDSWKRTTKFHLGSAALGSFILAIVQFLRALVWIFEKEIEAAHDNRCIRYCLTCVKCCLDCIIRFLKFFSKNAYIYTAITGESFCSAARSSFSLIVSNLMEVAVVNMVGPFLMFLGKIFVSGASGVACYALLRFYEQIEFAAIPVLLCMFLAFGVATIFFQIFEIAIDTILLSLLIDIKQKTFHMSAEMRELLDYE